MEKWTKVAAAGLGLGALVLGLLISGCEPGAPTMPVTSPDLAVLPAAPEAGTRDTTDCLTSSGVLNPLHALTLVVNSSSVEFESRSVAQSMPVVFSICTIDTAGLTLYPKCQSVGPLPDFSFAKSVLLKVSFEDAGLSGLPVEDKAYNVFRQIPATGDWELAGHAKVKNGKVKYHVNKTGIYALTRDSVWYTTGTFTPEAGGSVNLLTSVLSAMPQSVTTPTEVSFAITVAWPDGLPGATQRIFDFGPDGLLFTPGAPATLHVSFADAGLPGTGTPWMRTYIKDFNYTLYFFNPDKQLWEPQPTLVDPVKQEFIVTLTHFSRYAFGR